MRPRTRIPVIPEVNLPAQQSSSSSQSTASGTMTPPVAAVELPAPGQQRLPSQGPYKYGMLMLCLGALINWLGLAENYIEPVRYIGVACIITGAVLICVAMCCWVNSEAMQTPQETSAVHVIDIEGQEARNMKPPDYETVTGAPPSYDVAIKLSPTLLLHEAQQQTSPPAYTPPFLK